MQRVIALINSISLHHLGYESCLNMNFYILVVLNLSSIIDSCFYHLITSLAKEVMFSVELACMSVCLFVSNITQKSYKWIAMKFYGEVQGDTMKN